MPTRSQVKMVNSGVYLYQHYYGYNLTKDVKTALKMKQKWTDEEYLTRIIFEEMLYDEDDFDPTIQEKTIHLTQGYGIGTIQHDDIEWLIQINVENQTIVVKYGYNSLDIVWSGTFNAFIESDVSIETLVPSVYK